MDKVELQKTVNQVAKEHGACPVKLVVTDSPGAGLACYTTYRVKIRGKLDKKHHPQNITVYSWDTIKAHPAEVAYRVGHELAHHIINVKHNSLTHNTAFYDLEEALACKLSKLLVAR